MLFYFGSSVGNSFTKHNKPVEQAIALTNPAINYLEFLVEIIKVIENIAKQFIIKNDRI